jgi:predicted methyltransferase
MKHNNLTILCVVAAFILAGCGQSEPEATAETEAAPAVEDTAAPEAVVAMTGTDLGSALTAASRSEEDVARDGGRKPAEVLGFLGVESGMQVIDLMAAGGWYSEVLSIAVGDTGSVDAQNSPLILSFSDGAYGVSLSERIGDRLTNVTRVDSSWTELGASGAQYDAALSALNIHDAYYLESPEAAAELMASTYTVLKPGGVFGVIDHVGNPDADNNSLHRIDKAIVVEIATAAGFIVEADSDLLSNSEDDHTLMVFDDGIRGKTDRFLLKLRKPAE